MFSVLLLRVFFFDKCFLLLLFFLLLLRYLFFNSKFFRNEIVFKWHFVVLFHWCRRVFNNCEIEHWAYVIYFFDFFHFFMSYWVHSRSNLMFCLLTIDASMCDFYFVFIASICLLIFYTMISFREILAHLFNVIIFVAVKALNYFLFSWKYYCIPGWPLRREIPQKKFPSLMGEGKLKKKIFTRDTGCGIPHPFSFHRGHSAAFFSLSSFKNVSMIILLVDWLIHSFIRRCDIKYVGLMWVYLLVLTYRKILQRKKNSYFLSLIDCFSRLFRNSFDINSMLFFICCSLISWYVLLLIADWMKMFMNYCELS